MRFLKLGPQHAVNTGEIEQLVVRGREDNCRIDIILVNNPVCVTAGFFGSFREAESALLELIAQATASW